MIIPLLKRALVKIAGGMWSGMLPGARSSPSWTEKMERMLC
jgi:hypothetical protein